MARSSDTFRAMAESIVEAYREDDDAEVYNLIEKGLADDPMKLAWALTRIAASTGDGGESGT